MKYIGFLVVLLVSFAAHANDVNLNCLTATSSKGYPTWSPASPATPCPVQSAPSQASASNGGAQAAFSTNSITSSNAYQQVVAATNCTHGGLIENTSGVAGGTFYVDWTAGITAGGTTLGNGASTVAPTLTAGQAGGKQSIPPTADAVFVYGPSGATYRGYCS